jgi:hypothetical protein
MTKKRKEFEFPANPEYFNCEDANEDASYGGYEDVMNGFATEEDNKEVVTHVNHSNYDYNRGELGYTDIEYEEWLHSATSLRSVAPKLCLGERKDFMS